MKNIEAKIEEAFRETFLLPREMTITGFLADVLSSKYKFREDDRKIEVISVYYYAQSPVSILFALPNYEYYSPDKTAYMDELNLKEHGFEDYTYTDVQELCKKVLDENHVHYETYLDENDLPDLSHFLESQSGIEISFLSTYWKKAKEQVHSKTLGFLESSDGAGGIYDLDNSYQLPFEIELDEYLRSHGFNFEKE
ncbi:hypothetical protein MKJ01_15560 [Chryseobacterium sp. SSA4.19]|uniref:hypothetical protein n=1 Tax=Chryseobacterium sp. SSA4.19 TaxID=2919915 RepID=UPI001F4DC310|nr:hypothetical protein [Chryseobacterium sp. SSA4.19]MCJ8155184.1 hypothetical protein [Chryseobacterium sp. SSA4.19]